jgi:ribosomal protein L37AE/L43A
MFKGYNRRRSEDDVSMVKKICCYCGKNSYSAMTRGTWICPHCGKDITAEPSYPAK